MERNRLLFIGTYTKPEDHVQGHAEGIYVYRFDEQTGGIEYLSTASDIVNPSYLTVHPFKPLLYAVSEINDFQGRETGAVVSYNIDPESGRLNMLNAVESRGTMPCHVSVDKDGRYAFAANYISGSIASFKIEHDGSLSEAVCSVQRKGKSVNPERQEGPHTHAVVPDPSNRYILVPDLGTDELAVFAFNREDGSLVQGQRSVRIDPGSGPRHIAFHTSNRFLYLLSELASTITAMKFDEKSCTFSSFQTVSALPEGFSGFSAGAAVRVHPSGKFLYASNRGHDSVSWFVIDGNTGELTPAGWESTRGRTPRDFTISPDGRFLLAANQDSDSVVTFRVDERTGSLEYLRSTEIASPVCLYLSNMSSVWDTRDAYLSGQEITDDLVLPKRQLDDIFNPFEEESSRKLDR